MSFEKPIGFLRDQNGDRSLGRLISFVGMVLGVWEVIFGNLVTYYETFIQTGVHTANGVALAALGLGLFSSGALAKAWQAQSENRAPQIPQ